MITTVALSKSPIVTFYKVSRTNVNTLTELNALEQHYGKPHKVCRITYGDDDDMTSLSIRTGGRTITVDVTQTGCEYALRFQSYDYVPQKFGSDDTLWNRVR